MTKPKWLAPRKPSGRICPACEGDMRKFGFYKDTKKRRWQCLKCGLVTIHAKRAGK